MLLKTNHNMFFFLFEIEWCKYGVVKKSNILLMFYVSGMLGILVWTPIAWTQI